MSDKLTLEELEKHRSFIEHLYDSYRLVDPGQKKVIEFFNLNENNESCYSLWGRSKPCENCISFYSSRECKSKIKLFSTMDRIMIIRAIPIENDKRPLVLELLKDITDSLIYDSERNPDVNNIIDAVSELNNMVTKDHLTFLYNRRYLDDRLPVDVSNAIRNKTPLSVIFLDVDDFKKINDNYGHDVGDLVLKAVADVLKSCISIETDWAARYGGDEFFICLTKSDQIMAQEIANRILRSFEKISIPVNTNSIIISVSVGIHTMINQAQQASDIIKAADQNMYKSKKNGKNSITASFI